MARATVGLEFLILVLLGVWCGGLFDRFGRIVAVLGPGIAARPSGLTGGEERERKFVLRAHF
jgi:hypothetical protein